MRERGSTRSRGVRRERALDLEVLGERERENTRSRGVRRESTRSRGVRREREH